MNIVYMIGHISYKNKTHLHKWASVTIAVNKIFTHKIIQDSLSEFKSI